jgi:hypothetical protein
MVKKETVKLYVEGGGDTNSLHTECRRAFSEFLKKSGLDGHMPRIVACGSRNEAYDDYCTAVSNGENAFLLVDSESEIRWPNNNLSSKDFSLWNPWDHLKKRVNSNGQITDNWTMPDGGSIDDCHMMVQVMESWFLADVSTLKEYYGQKFNENCLPQSNKIEEISKATILNSL